MGIWEYTIEWEISFGGKVYLIIWIKRYVNTCHDITLTDYFHSESG
jgi:hypothetical protein